MDLVRKNNGMNWINSDGGRWQAVVNTLMKYI
jgi:hypothetical protein